MASWPLRWDAWIQTGHTPFLRLCPFFAPSVASRREGGTSHTTETSGLSSSHFGTVCLHTHLSASGVERERERGKRHRERKRPGEWWNEMRLHVCVCVWSREREKTSSDGICPSVNNQKLLSAWVWPHPATSAPGKMQAWCCVSGQHIFRRCPGSNSLDVSHISLRIRIHRRWRNSKGLSSVGSYNGRGGSTIKDQREWNTFNSGLWKLRISETICRQNHQSPQVGGK